MTDEIRTTHEIREPGETTVIRETRTSSGGSGWVLALLLVLALVAGIWFFSRSNSSEVAKDNAVAGAANDIGEAARDVGSAAKEAADEVGGR